MKTFLSVFSFLSQRNRLLKCCGVLATMLLALDSSAFVPTTPLVDDVNPNNVVSVTSKSTTALHEGTWYAMYNMGRKVYLNGNGKATATAPVSGVSFRELSPYLVRFISVGSEGKYLIQNADGNYYRDFSYNSNAGVTADTANGGTFTVAQIIMRGTGYWYIQGTKYVMDCNGSDVVGWATTAPTSVMGNDSWRIFPVTISDPSDLTGGAKVSYQLAVGGLFRIPNYNRPAQYIAEDTTESHGTTTLRAENDLSQMWIIEHNSDGFSLRNVQTGHYLQSDYSCTPAKAYWTLQLSPNNSSTSDTKIIICHGKVERGTQNCANLRSGVSGLTDWYYDNDHNSEWNIEAVPSTEIDTAAVKAHLDKVLGMTGLDLSLGAYYRFQSLNSGGMLAENLADNYLITSAADSAAWNEYWKVEYDTTNNCYNILSLYSSKYINHKAANENSACNGNYVTSNTNSVNRSWLIQPSSYPWQTTYVIAEPNKPATALGVKDATCANADVESTNAQWILQRVDLTPEEVAAASEAYDEYRLLRNTSSTLLNNRLQIYFADYACTRLKDQYQSLSDDSLSILMHNSDLPRMLINMALKVKNNTWGHREKEFRIYDYKAYSDHTKWGATALMGTGYQFSPQTGPTGISVKKGDAVAIICGANPAANSTLSFSSNDEYTVNTNEIALKRGINVYVADSPGFLFIHHTITNVTKKLADFAPITIHIEGGRVQGYFDITRGHTNADWKDFVENLFQDKIVHLKSKYYEFNMLYSGVLAQIRDGELDEVDTDGTPKGIEGTLHRWDTIVAVQRHLMNADQFSDRFNCMLSATSSSKSNPYASSYGTYYPGVGTLMNYTALTHGTENDNGGNFWCIAHETGHVHQSLIKMCGTTEISNNFFAQVNTWTQGSNTGRGGPWSVAQTSFHNGQFWADYDLWQRSRMYFQLWLYFHLQGYDTQFYPKLFNKFRANPMSWSTDSLHPSSGTTDYLRFAEYCCDIAQADLSEFFQFWGFFVPIRNFHIGDYSNNYQTTTQAQIDASIAKMKKYPKKLGNILFIDERIEKYPANYPGMAEGTMRVATTSEATPGDASEVGELGMFTMFHDNPDYQQYSCVVRSSDGQCVVSQSSGKGAVGFKVYDKDNNLTYVSNTYQFTLPSKLLNRQYTIVAALGDGTDRLLHLNGADSTVCFKVYDADHEVVATSTSTSYSIPANIANTDYYVMAVKSGGTEQLVYETSEDLHDITGIHNAISKGNSDGEYKAFDPSAPAYTIDGRLTGNLQKGRIYIQNGKKVKY